jgi:hypothetical protein
MHKSFPMWRLLLTLFLGCAAGARTGDAAPPVAERLRPAVTKSLGFLEKEMDGWMNSKDCNGCHHVPEMLWTYREAGRRGVAIDQKKIDELLEWAVAREKKPTGGPEVSALLKLALPDRPAPAVTKLIVDGQQPDGSWKPGGQFEGMQGRGKAEAGGNSARLFLLALATQPEDRPALEAAQAKAALVLDADVSPKTVETLVFRLLYARRFGPTEKADAWRDEILKQQQPDGGWAYQIGETQSDPLATGQALYALQQEPAPSAKEPIARGQTWLLDRQKEEGGWAVDITHISRTDRSAPAKAKSFKDATGIYTFWSSAWATLGLLQGVPVVEKVDAK